MRCCIYRQSQLDIGWTEDHCARLDEIAAEDHSYIATAAERARRENTWVLVLDSSGPNGPMNQREDHQEAKKLCERRNRESGQAHHRPHPRDKVRMRPDQPFAWRNEGSERVDPKTDWKWYDTQPAASSSSLGWQPSSSLQSSSWSQTLKWDERSFFTKQGVSLTGNGDSLVSDGVCQHFTQPTHTSPARTVDFFSFGSRLKSSSQVSCVSHKNSHSFTLEHYLTSPSFHLHPYPTFYSTVHQTFIAPPSRGDFPCADPSNVSFGPVAETTSPTSNGQMTSTTFWRTNAAQTTDLSKKSFSCTSSSSPIASSVRVLKFKET